MRLSPRPLFTWIFFILWFVLSGHNEPFLLISGAIAALLVSWLCSSLPSFNRSWLGWLTYTPWLLGRIILANLHVAKLTLAPRDKLKPKLFSHKTTLPTTALQVLLGQSITLTPGTITTHLDELKGELTVHSIDEASVTDLTDGAFEKHIDRCYSKSSS